MRKDQSTELNKKMKELINTRASPTNTVSKISSQPSKTYLKIPQATSKTDIDPRENINLHIETRVTKDELKAQICEKNRAVHQLNLNRKFFESELVPRIDRFKEDLKEVKPQVFDKTFKSNLHYIYKHYENFKNGMNPSHARDILDANLTKQHSEINELHRKIDEITQENKRYEQKLLSMATHEGLIKRSSNVFDKMTKQEIETQIKVIDKDNLELSAKLSEIKKNRDSQLMKLQIKMEQKGRKEMERRAVKLALAHVDNSDSELAGLKHQLRTAIEGIEQLQSAKKQNSYFQLEKKRQKLLAELNNIRIVS